MNTLLIKNGLIVTMDPQRRIFKGDLLIENGLITRVSPNIDVTAHKIIDATDKIIIPGLIQTHIHLTQSLFRGQADDLELLDWLKKRIWPLEASHTEESNYYSALLGISELIMGGTTSIIDMETVNHTESAFSAIEKSGIRAISGKCMMDYGTGVPQGLMEDSNSSVEESVRLLRKWHNKDNGRIKYGFAPRFVVSCSEELLVKVRDLAKEYGVMVHTHASENQGEIALVKRDRGLSNIRYLEKIGLLGPNTILAHCIWLDDEEMKIIADTATKIAHCPNSNLKLASGIAKIPELLALGADISLAADGAPCNNNLDMFKEMRSAALIQKARLLNPTVMPASKIFELATLGGAKAMGQLSALGSLEVGKRGDVVIVDLNKIHTTPSLESDIISNLVYNACAQDVVTTIVEGRVLMEDRKLTTLNTRDIIDNCNNIIKRQLDKAQVKK